MLKDMADRLSIDNPESDRDLEELRFARTQSYFDRSVLIRTLIALVFALSLFFVLHFQQIKVEPLELGTFAKKYVISQIDFTFPDDEATIILRQEVMRSVGPVYKVRDEEVSHSLSEFQKYITEEGEGKKKFAKIRERGDAEAFSFALNTITDALYESRFVDGATLKFIEQLPYGKLPIDREYFFAFFTPSEGEASHLPKHFWLELEKRLNQNGNSRNELAVFVESFFQPLKWHFLQDEGMEYSLRRAIIEQIPETYTPIHSSERIIDKGEKVTTRHLVIMQAMKEALNKKRTLLHPITIVGSLLLTLVFMLVASIYIYDNHKEIFLSNRKLALLVTIILLSLFLAKVTELFLLYHQAGLIDLVRFPLFVPFAAILISSLMNVRIASFAAIFITIIMACALAVETIPFLVINIITALVALLSARAIVRRQEMITISAKAWLASILVVLAFDLYDSTVFYSSFFTDVISTFIFMALTAILVVGLLPILESIFKILTNITLMEFMDPSNLLLRRLIVEAPGTYQHSILVGNLAEAAASAIGANGLFCRVSTQYHDIGKLVNPQYFSENQLGGVDMHQLLTPSESAQVIIAHVSEGVLLARKNGLPEQFIDIIKEHHGTTLVYYFYHKQKELMSGGKGVVDSADFRYSGPKPRSKESTIIMIADTLEAAARSLDLYNETTIMELVESLISQKMEAKQFEDSLLTLEELSVVKAVLIKTLLAASHPRIKYPPHAPGEEG
jgi:putative nucleotidyltransferase with HDIG domain